MKAKNIFLFAAASFGIAYAVNSYFKNLYEKQMNKIEDHKEIIEIKVKSPELDTWWEIAGKYGPDGTGKTVDRQFVVDHLKKLNNTTKDLLYENQKVRVPKYEK